MAEFSELTPLFQEDEDSVWARMILAANAGVAPDDPAWVDIREGSMFWIIGRAFALEAARLWDALANEMAAAYIIFAWGDYLDYHGANLNAPRKPGVAATGVVTFTGTDGTLIATGTEVQPVQVDADVNPPVFKTTATGTIASGTLDLAVVAAETGVTGNIAAAAITLLNTAVPGVESVTNTNAITGGQDVESDEAYRERLLLEQGTSAPGSILDHIRWCLQEPGVGRANVVPLWAGPDTVMDIVMTETGDPVSDAIVDSLQNRIDPPSFTGELAGDTTFPTATVALASVIGLRAQGIVHVDGQVLTYTGLNTGTNSLTGVTGGSGTIAGATSVIQRGAGGGTAAVGADVTVTTPIVVDVSVAGAVTFDSGYSLDGDGGTIATRSALLEAIITYVNGLDAGEDIVFNHLVAAFFEVDGVYDVTMITPTADVSIDSSSVPPQIAHIDEESISLS